ncbi:MAG: hypothetical protein AVDCRST_MAG67-470 [uncultured Solirubrobacteraceae bacterium]|uniref:DUF3105 domain-containing protein n=1 Tax=uncultured Solirubrobacteraceae bacterium TaxID=1162706 RepID=A0A6J4RJB5_9ACTN|nr:MAG: hypothetical protein AVDCRST_MAG67-470 [uncultured Solirubrobacteraceae bacterium]
MSSRKEEKERLRKEREERERAAAAKAKRARLLQLIGGVVVACAVIAGVAYAVSSGGGGDDGADVDDDQLKSAAQAAGCVYRAFPNEGEDHVTEKLTEADFKTNPPTSGAHNPEPAPDGIYVAGNEPEIANWVHTLEHGRILLQYRRGTERSVVTQLERLFNEDVDDSGRGYHSVVMQNNTNMPFEVAAVAWRHYVACREFTPKAIDAMRVFREELVDKAPEKIP